MPGDSGDPVVTTLVCCVLFRTRGYGCIGHPAFPAPSDFFGRWLSQKLGRIAPRDRGCLPSRLNLNRKKIPRRPGLEPGPITTNVHYCATLGRQFSAQLTSVVMGPGVRRDDESTSLRPIQRISALPGRDAPRALPIDKILFQLSATGRHQQRPVLGKEWP